MMYKDKNDVINRINKKTEYIVLELGCGETKLFEKSIALDIVELPKVDIVCDLNAGFPFLEDKSVDEIHSSHFLEHVKDIGILMRESYRILKPGGKSYITVPHFSNSFYYSDYTHKTTFGIYSMSYFSKEVYFKRRVPVFYNDLNFKILSVKINLKSRWLLPRLRNKFFMKFLNQNKTLLEYYEAHLCYRYPATELTFIIEKN